MKIIGLTRVRNEQYIIQDTLDHMSEFCDKIVVYDDASVDRTAEICHYHPKVVEVFQNKKWSDNRAVAEWQSRSMLLSIGKKYAGEDDWFVYMDADERIEFPWDILQHCSKDVIGFRCKLFDYYITPDDIELHYSQRKYLGPEYRNILMIFRNLPTLDYSSPDQREVHLRDSRTVTSIGYVKHYGKAVSLKQWDDTCEYYGRYFPKYSAKWNARRGKAIHRTSSFGNELITWDQKEIKSFPLTREIEKNSIY